MGKDVGTNKLKFLKPLGYSTPHKERNAEAQRQQMCEVLPKLDLNAARPVTPEFEKAFGIIKVEVGTFGRELGRCDYSNEYKEALEYVTDKIACPDGTAYLKMMAIKAGLVSSPDDEEHNERPSKKMKTMMVAELEAAKARVVALQAQVETLTEENGALQADNMTLVQENMNLTGELIFQTRAAPLPKMADDLDVELEKMLRS